MTGGRLRNTLDAAVDEVRNRLRWFARLPQLEARVAHLEARARDLEKGALHAEALADAHHETRLMANHATTTSSQALAIGRRLDDHVQRLVSTSFDMERWAEIESTSRWIAEATQPETLLVSIVMPTRDRSHLVRRAVESVTSQDYGKWELLIVDDASTDETPTILAELANDPRIVTLTGPGKNAGTARNVALERASGDVVVYLDDDNRMHPSWLKSVAWAFTQLPDTEVAYGARLVDDWNHVRHLDGPGLPSLHFERFDRETIQHRNQVDMGAIAHRPSSARFEGTLRLYGDWDLFLQLTLDHDPLELPVVAVLYTSRVDGRLSDAGDDETEENYVRARDRARRGLLDSHHDGL